MKILWLSKHEPLPVQVAELGRLFGEVELCQDVNPFANAEEVLRRYQEGGYDDLVVVAPLSVIARLCELGLHPLWAQMEQVRSRSEADLSYRGRLYRFDRFRRIKAVELLFEEIETKESRARRGKED